MEKAKVVEDIKELIKDYSYEIHYKSDAEYDYLEDDDAQVFVVKNTSGKQQMDIIIDEGRITLCILDYHTHYEYSDDIDYEYFNNDFIKLVSGEKCVGVLYYNKSEELVWLGGRMLTLEEVNSKSYKHNFNYIYSMKEFRDELIRNGGEVQYIFWDDAKNIIKKIEKQ